MNPEDVTRALTADLASRFQAMTPAEIAAHNLKAMEKCELLTVSPPCAFAAKKGEVAMVDQPEEFKDWGPAKPAPERPDLAELLRQSAERVNAMTPLQRAYMQVEQRESWVIGELMLEHPDMTRDEALALLAKSSAEIAVIGDMRRQLSDLAARADARATELLDYNNRELERRRAAERDAAELMDALAPFAEIGRKRLSPRAPVGVLVEGPELISLNPEAFEAAARAYDGEA